MDFREYLVYEQFSHWHQKASSLHLALNHWLSILSSLRRPSSSSSSSATNTCPEEVSRGAGWILCIRPLLPRCSLRERFKLLSSPVACKHQSQIDLSKSFPLISPADRQLLHKEHLSSWQFKLLEQFPLEQSLGST